MFSHVVVGSNDIDRSKKFYDAVAEQPRQPAVVVVSRAAGHRLEPRHGTSAIDDQHRRAGF